MAMAIHCWRRVALTAAVAVLLHCAGIRTSAQESAEMVASGSAARQGAFDWRWRFEAKNFVRRGWGSYAQAMTGRFEQAADEGPWTGKTSAPSASSAKSAVRLTSEQAKSEKPQIYETTVRRRHANWVAFVPLSAAVYTMGLLDQTATVGHADWRMNEEDPLVKPFVQAPAPVFLDGGVAFESGVNWLAWRIRGDGTRFGGCHRFAR